MDGSNVGRDILAQQYSQIIDGIQSESDTGGTDQNTAFYGDIEQPRYQLEDDTASARGNTMQSPPGRMRRVHMRTKRSHDRQAAHSPSTGIQTAHELGPVIPISESASAQGMSPWTNAASANLRHPQESTAFSDGGVMTKVHVVPDGFATFQRKRSASRSQTIQISARKQWPSAQRSGIYADRNRDQDGDINLARDRLQT